jgi:UDP-glucose 4-epimerase
MHSGLTEREGLSRGLLLVDPRDLRLQRKSVTSTRDLKIAVIGGGGFIGTHLCNALARDGARVAALGRSQLDPGALDRRVEWSQCELSDGARIAEGLAGAHVVYHLASSTTPPLAEADPAADVADNVVPTIRLMEQSARAGVRRLIFVSSGGTVYGEPATIPIPETAPTEPISAYGLQKLAIERYLGLFRRKHGLDSVVLRVSNPYGPLQRARRSQGVIAAFLEAALRGEALEIWGDGRVTRDFVYIDELVEAMLLAAVHGGPSRVFNVGSGRGVDINTVAKDIESVLGGGRLRRIHHAARAADVPVNILDVSLIRDEMGWRPRMPWIDGLARAASWMETALAGSQLTPPRAKSA